MIPSYAVIGCSVKLSSSPKIHRWFAEQNGCDLIYRAISVPDSEFEQQVMDFFKNGGHGLNITHPYKIRAYAMHDSASIRCHQAQAANTLIWEQGRIHADNTDGVGFIVDLQQYCEIKEQHILILGAGGAVHGLLGSIKCAAPQSITIVNRTPKIIQNYNIPVINYDMLQEHYTLIVNATSATFPERLLPEKIFQRQPLCYDLNYQTTSSFLTYARKFGCATINGLGMLIEQAAESFFLWHAVRPNTKNMPSAMLQSLASNQLNVESF